MGWSPLGTQFCLELGFGVLLALACVGRAPLGPFFHRVLGTTALVPLLAATVMPVAEGELRLIEPQILISALAVALYPGYAGPLKSARRAQLLYAALASDGVPRPHAHLRLQRHGRSGANYGASRCRAASPPASIARPCRMDIGWPAMARCASQETAS